MSRGGRLAVLTVVVAMLLFSASGAVASEDLDAEIEVADPVAGAETTHTVDKKASNDTAGSSLNYVDVDYSDGEAPDLPETTDEVVRAGVDTDGNGEIDENATEDLDEVELEDGDQLVEFSFGGVEGPEEGDRVIVEYEVTNPDDEGPHDVGVQVNDDQDDFAWTEYELEPLAVEEFTFETVDRTADLRLTVTDDVDTIEVDLDDRDVTLDEDDFEALGDGEYLAENVNEGDAGTYGATLDEASRDDDDDNAADDETATTTLAPLAIVDGNTSDDTPRAGERVVGQAFTAEVEGLTNADDHEFVFEFPDGFEGDIEDATITVDGEPAESTEETDNDVTGTFALDDGDDLNDATVTLEADVTYPDEGEVDVDGTVTDGGDGSQDADTLATVDVDPAEAVRVTDGTITNDGVEPAETVDHELTVSLEDLSRNAESAFTVEVPEEVASTATVTDVDATDDDVTVEESDPSIDDERVELDLDTGDDSGAADTVDTDVVVEFEDATYDSDARGETVEFDAEVEDHGDDTSDEERPVTTVDVADRDTVAVVGGDADPAQVEPGENVTDGTVTVEIEGLIRDGDPADVELAFPDELTDAVAVSAVTADGATVSSNETVDGERVEFDLDAGDGGGTTDADVTVAFDADYPAAVDDATLGFDAAVVDSDGNDDDGEPVATVDVAERPSGITTFDLDASDDDLTLTVESMTRLDAMTVELSGPTDRTLDVEDVDEADLGDDYRYRTTVEGVADGDYDATLTDATDVYGEAVADGESDDADVSTSSGPGSGGTGGSSSSGTADECEPAAETELVAADSTVHHTSVCARSGAELTANFTGSDEGADDDVTVDRYEFVSATDSDFAFNVSVEPATVDDLAHTARIAVGNDTALDEELENGTLVVDVPASAVGDAPAEEVRFRNDGEAVDHTVVTDTGDAYRFALATNASASYVVGVPDGEVTVTEATLVDEDLVVGDDAEAEAVVEREGYTPATATVTLWMDDAAVAERTVTLAGDERTTLTFAWEPTELGVFDVTVGEADAGDLTVAAEETATDTSPTYLWLLLLLLLLLVTGIVRRIRGDDGE
ncbi:hypothetical protein JCM17823_10700 [Halorubrum gandharaense]